MITIYQWIIDNWELVILIGVLLVVLTMTGTITQSIRNAKTGMREAITPLGFVIFLIIVYMVYQMYLSIMETI